MTAQLVVLGYWGKPPEMKDSKHQFLMVPGYLKSDKGEGMCGSSVQLENMYALSKERESNRLDDSDDNVTLFSFETVYSDSNYCLSCRELSS